MLRSENWSLGQIAQALRIHETTVSTYLKEYLLGKINIKSGGSESFLSAQQSDMLISHLHNHTYQAVHEIILYVREKWSILYSISGMNQWLHRHGFNYKKPILMMTQNAMSRLRSFPSVATKKHHYRYGYDSIFFYTQTKNLFAWEYYKMRCFVSIFS